MALLDFLKRKKEVEKSKKEVEKKEKPEIKAGKVKVEKKPISKPIKATVNKGIFSYDVVRQPHISEKASYLAEKDQYTFKVLKDFNKKDITKSIEGLYGVDVLSVKVINIPAKKRRIGRTEGFKKGYKKAIVKIKEGQKIEIL